ncbi:SDR family oxidoreductase [Actinoallomurus soli]|uniref:SDR family oxidoreductase n=1 Tax=Actinoallomurus soli TaxID=2952535 RepID=UPI002092AA44|nr:SDR family oxidoreductase [Actinoallomurus soli]MCO5970844.1 SDR family oxidoreductase [Actinoallomurus soli]
MASKLALVTGANKGIGFEIARGLARHDCAVLVAARDRARGEQAVAALRDDGGEFHYVRVDVTDASSIAEAAGWIEERFGRLDILVNNAGITDRPVPGPPSETDLPAMRAVYETNVFGVVAVTNALLPLLRRSPAGRIVNVSSGLASISAYAAPDSAMPPYLAYASSKSALNAITVQYGKELRDTAIKVNACEPGYTATDLNEHRGLRTPAQSAKVAIDLALLGEDGPTCGYFDENGPLPW